MFKAKNKSVYWIPITIETPLIFPVLPPPPVAVVPVRRVPEAAAGAAAGAARGRHDIGVLHNTHKVRERS